MPIMTYLSRRYYIAEGGRDYTSPPYIEKDDISVYVNGTKTTAWTWFTDSIIRLNAVPADGSDILVVRDTDDVLPKVTFQPGPLTTSDLNVQFKQDFYLIQEGLDIIRSASYLTPEELANTAAQVAADADRAEDSAMTFDTAYLLDKLTGSITAGELAQTLSTPIAAIPGLEGDVSTLQSEMLLSRNQWTVKVQEGGYVSGVGLLLYPDWSDSTGYQINDFVWYDNDVYKCIQAGTNKVPSDEAAYWTLVPYGEKSEFIILADKFAIVKPDGSGGLTVPFVVGTIGGVSTVGIAGNLVIDGTLTADKLQANQVLIGHTIQSSTYTAGSAGWRINADGTAELNNVTIRGGAQSPNYAAGTTGWKIASDGSAELNNATVRGTLVVGSGSSGYGNLSDKPTQLSGINATEASKLAGIAAGADVTSANTAADTAKVNGTAAATIATATGNFNGRNDRTATAVVAPTILTDGSAVDHVVNTDGSVNISFEWAWAGTEADIDGFQVYVRGSTSDSTYTFGTTPAEEDVYTVPAAIRAFILRGVPANDYYTFGVRAFRVVDPDINATGLLLSTLVKATGSGENPYRPAATVAFAGNITGTIQGQSSDTLVTKLGTIAEGATAGATWGTNISGQPTDADLLNNTEEGLISLIRRPAGGLGNQAASSVTGAIVITLPQSWTNTMMKFAVDVFNYVAGKSFTLELAGYNGLSSTTWRNCSANLLGGVDADNRVRFGHDGTKCCVVIGETNSAWSYPKVLVRDFLGSYSTNWTVAKWATGWAVSWVTDLTGYTFTADFADSLLDAGAIKGQGTLATKSAVAAADCDTTIIDGGKIITSLLTATNIQTGTLTATCIAVESLSFTKIDSSAAGRIVPVASVVYTNEGAYYVTMETATAVLGGTSDIIQVTGHYRWKWTNVAGGTAEMTITRFLSTDDGDTWDAGTEILSVPGLVIDGDGTWYTQEIATRYTVPGAAAGTLVKFQWDLVNRTGSNWSGNFRISDLHLVGLVFRR